MSHYPASSPTKHVAACVVAVAHTKYGKYQIKGMQSEHFIITVEWRVHILHINHKNALGPH